MAESTVAAPEVQKPTTTESTRHHERYVAPPVDIYETPEGLVVLADLPGVAQEGLDVRVDNHVLTIRGHAHLRSPAFRPVRGVRDQAQQPWLIRAVGPPTARN